MAAVIPAVMTSAAAAPALYAVAGLTAISSLQAARAQAKGLAAQATMARMQGAQEALKYKQQGVQVLDNILRTQAAITARAGAGGIDPFSGSAKALNQFALARGAEELYTTREGQVIAKRGGEMQAAQLMTQAKATMAAGRLQAVTAFGQAYATTSLLGAAPAGGGVTGGSQFGTATGIQRPFTPARL